MSGILEGIEPKGDSFEEGAPFKKKLYLLIHGQELSFHLFRSSMLCVFYININYILFW